MKTCTQTKACDTNVHNKLPYNSQNLGKNTDVLQQTSGVKETETSIHTYSEYNWAKKKKQ